MPEVPLLRMEGITKSFAGVPALKGVDLTLRAGEVHALVGENGAGKSTLIKVLTGAYRRDGGAMYLEEDPVDFRSPQDAQARGVVAVYQEVNLLGGRTVAENILLGREPCRWGLLDWRKMNAQAEEVLARLGVSLSPRAVLGSLSVALQQMVAIARGVSLGARVLVLDEPTSALAEREVAVLFEAVRRLRAEGVGVVYISHRFDELYALCDRVTVLRDGKLVTTRPLAGLDRLDLVCLMLGKDREALRQEAQKHRPPPTTGPTLLRARGLKRGRRPDGVSLEVRRGEVVGLGGLLGSGRTETARLLFGLDERDAGEVTLDGRPLALSSPRQAVEAGMGFVPEDRKAEGIIPELSVCENLTLAALPLLSRLGVVSRARQRQVVQRFVQRLRIKVASPEQKVRELSGGNQQKVILARWLCRHPRLLILDEPTRGIDIGARGEIQDLISEMAREGLGVLLIASELEELIEGSSRVVVLRDGRSVAELDGAITEEQLLRAAAGAPAEAGEGQP